MNLFELFVKIGVDDQASKNISSITSKLGGGLKTAAKIGTAAISVASTAIVALTKNAVESYAQYEQLVGGAELMFGEAFDFVKEKSQEAYKTVQMSQNEYLQQVNGFATGLKTALGGNEQAAAELADKIITAEADIIAATGNTAENVQNAFNGIMRSNFTMLDNLQIGITPTKEGFQEVIDKVNEWNKANGEATKYQMGNLADMQSALVDYIEMVGMSGYATAEASKTIQGSLASAKGAWQNLLTGIADNNADLGQLVGNFVESIGTVAENIIPRIDVAISGIGGLIQKVAPIIVSQIPTIVSTLVPELVASVTTLLTSVFEALPNLINTLFTSVIPNVLLPGIGNLINLILSNLPTLLSSILTALPSLISGLVTTVISIISNIDLFALLSPIIESLPDAVQKISDALLSNLPLLLEGVISLVLGIVKLYPTLVKTFVKIIPEFYSAFIPAVLKSLPTLLSGLGQLIVELVKALPYMLVAAIAGSPLGIMVMAIFGFLKDGLGEVWEKLGEVFQEGWNAIVNFFTEKIPIIFENFINSLKQLPERISYIIGLVIGFIGTLPEKIREFLLMIITNYVEWVTGFYAKIIDGIPKLINKVIEFFKKLPEKIKTFFLNIITNYVNWTTSFYSKIITEVPKLINKVVDFFKELPEKIKEVGKDIVTKLWDGISSAWGWLKEKFGSLLGSFGEGFLDGVGVSFSAGVDGSHAGGLDYVPFDGYIAELHKGEQVLTAEEARDYKRGSRVVNVVQNIYSQAKTAADLMQEAQYQQERAVLFGV